MNGAVVADAVAIVGALTGCGGLWYITKAADREKRRDEASAERQRLTDLAAARADGAAEVRRELQPQIDLLRSQRDDARLDRDRFERELATAAARVSRLEDMLLRRRNGDDGTGN